MTGGAEAEVRQALRAWVRAHAGVEVADDFDDHTPLIEERYLTSLQIAELLVYLEELRGERLDVAMLRPGVFRDLDTVYVTFLAGASR